MKKVLFEYFLNMLAGLVLGVLGGLVIIYLVEIVSN